MTTVGESWARAARALRAAWWLVVEDMAMGAVLVAILAWWLALPVATWGHLSLHVVLPLLFGVVVVFEYRRAKRKLAPAGIAWRARPALAASALWLVVGLVLPVLLLWWVPPVQSLAAQVVSALVRIALAGALVVGTSLWWMAVSAREVQCQEPSS
jgi:hypothetical protein